MPRDGSFRSETSPRPLVNPTDVDSIVDEAIRPRLPDEFSALPAGFFAPSHDTLRRAWVLATEMRHREVMPAHLKLALVTSDELPELPPTRQLELRTHAFAELAMLESSIGADEASLPVASAALLVVLQDAIRRTQVAGASHDLEPEDLLEVLRDTTSAPAGWPPAPATPGDGAAPANLAPILGQVLTAADSARQTSSRTRSELRRSVQKQSSEFDRQLDELRMDTRTLLAGVHNTCRTINERMWKVETSHAECRRHIADTRKRTATIERRLSLRPSALGAMATVVMAIAIGVTIGLVLRHPAEFRLAASDAIQSAGGTLGALLHAR